MLTSPFASPVSGVEEGFTEWAGTLGCVVVPEHELRRGDVEVLK